jgi:Spy/CpxP family protein refolding chaperone
MRRIGFVGLLVTLLAALALASAADARPPFGGHHGPGHHRGPGPPGFIEEHAAQLGLDEETRAAIDGIVEESREQGRALSEEVRELHRGMRDLLSQEIPDETAVMAQADAIGQAETALHKQRLAAIIRIRALLTDEQRAELSRIREETRGQWREPLIEACESDVNQLCPEAEAPWSRRRCARDHWQELSPGCQDAIEAGRGKLRRGFRDRRGPDGPDGF